MKKYMITVLSFILWYGWVQAQTDLPTTRPLKIDAENTLDLTPGISGTSLRIPSIIDESLGVKDDKPQVKMLPDRELLQAGHNLKLDPKVGEKERKRSGVHFSDQYLGDFKTSAQFVGIVCRDHEYVDGDRIKVYHNSQVVEYNLMLSASFRGINIDLAPGFNHIEFEALNQGSHGPNTAQVVITDDKGVLLHNNLWNLSTGSKASLIIIKETE